LREWIAPDGYPIYILYRRKKCKECNWTGWEYELKEIPALFGGTYYLGRCPKCGTGGGSMSNIKTIDGVKLRKQSNK